MKIIQFCMPAPGELVALTDEGELWERYRDQRHFPAPHERPRYIWRKIEGLEVKPAPEPPAA